MNTTTSPAPVSASPAQESAATPVLTSTLAPAVLTAEQDIANLRGQLEQAEQRKAHLLHEEAIQRATVRRNAILALPAAFGVANLPGVIVLIRQEMTPSVATGGKRGFPRALSQETLDQMKAMLAAFATTKAVAAALKVGVSTVDAWKAKWGLTHRAIPGRPMPSAAPKARKEQGRTNGGHFSPAKKARILAALSKPGYNIAAISHREKASRQGVYDLLAKLRARQHLVAA